MPKRIRLSRAKGYRMPEGAVNVARGPGRKFGNPFVVGKDGTAVECVEMFTMLMAGRVCLTSKATPTDQMASLKVIKSNIGMLAGKDLACWCRSDKPCHADVLLKIANHTMEEQP